MTDFEVLLRLHRSAMSETQKEKEVKSPIWLYPLAQEKVFAKDLQKFLKEYIESILMKLENKLPGWVTRNNYIYSNISWEQEYRTFLADMEKEITLYFYTGLLDDTRLGRLLKDTSNKILDFSKVQWGKQTNAVLGMPYNSLPEDWAGTREMWLQSAYLSLKKMASDFNTQISSALMMGLMSHWTYEDFVEHFQSLEKKSTNTPIALLARNSTGLLVGSIIAGYSSSIKNDEYIWHTAMDERVRGNPMGKYPKAIPSHYVMEGLICKWSDPTVFSRNGITWEKKTEIMEFQSPSIPYGCRCTASMYWKNYLKERGL